MHGSKDATEDRKGEGGGRHEMRKFATVGKGTIIRLDVGENVRAEEDEFQVRIKWRTRCNRNTQRERQSDDGNGDPNGLRERCVHDKHEKQELATAEAVHGVRGL
jgi:hypothetical protein